MVNIEIRCYIHDDALQLKSWYIYLFFYTYHMKLFGDTYFYKVYLTFFLIMMGNNKEHYILLHNHLSGTWEAEKINSYNCDICKFFVPLQCHIFRGLFVHQSGKFDCILGHRYGEHNESHLYSILWHLYS